MNSTNVSDICRIAKKKMHSEIMYIVHGVRLSDIILKQIKLYEITLGRSLRTKRLHRILCMQRMIMLRYASKQMI
jgi:hypothetical protein